nr:Ycf45 [Thalassionema frauenfeldii]
MGVKFKMTNEVKNASIIIGLKKYLKKNNSLISIANNYNIPTYSLNFISYYGLVRLFSTINNSQ